MNRLVCMVVVGLSVVSAVVGCGGEKAEARERAQVNARSRSIAGSGGEQPRLEGEGVCDGRLAGREVSEYDTSGDDIPDVRKVFQSVGRPPTQRLILICRESDLNADGTKDVVREYNDEGRPFREESDRNFDGTMDEVTYFENGRIIRQELDSNADGRIDTKTYFENGKPVRAERDVAGRSQGRWQPDRWEYYEQGRLVRMGTDLDGDGRVDRWDRNDELQDKFEAEREAAEEQATQEEAEDQGVPTDASEGGEGDGGEGAENAQNANDEES